ncbi:hypothetical protein [Mycolicibacterium holsaticum]|uniref:hypothetical protein n=1 Tax=Mycolicibacterium holsaticum TaxID=152142 RepID=UPI001C7CD164|nr:hypothetical protein [Mycolicibacterium holsaticum]MDA4109822.1 hypothetical protein [Mycolicibacterium holsaticum DSM 44478 = JCM 12374]QZA10733.1 hypothetical protein K3U96_15775 [Mycolicibacterium holsaticum DSM 44478 = JCM 12374]UNC11768.1 hypothetical protein H5U41_11055 [Mycolicibacterium holsaticum DSM 44478 = JCM 12374]
MTVNGDRARAVADAVLYEGYLLYPYRASSRKNQSRWQFGVLGPSGAADADIGEDGSLRAQVLVNPQGVPWISGVARFLQLQHRGTERDLGGGRFEPVEELTAGTQTWLSWDEAVEREVAVDRFPAPSLPRTIDISVPAGRDVEIVDGGRLVRTRQQLHGLLSIFAEPDDDLLRLTFEVRNTGSPATDKDDAIATSLIGTHLLIEVTDGEFVSLLEPPDTAAGAVARCRQHRCFPVLAGRPGDHTLVLASPIILYDHPQIAEQSNGALYDSTEIDEILTLRVMTMTEDEKAQARATDPLAARIIDRCDSMSPEAMLDLHGVLRDPHADLVPEVPAGVDWWDPQADNAVRPERDAILVNGAPVARGSRVRLRPTRRADAQDLFYVGKIARVTTVHEDVDGDQHIGVVLEDDPAADMHEWYGRYLYFAPDEVEPLEGSSKWK